MRVLTREHGRGVPDGCKPFAGDLAVVDTVPVQFVDGADVLYHCAAELRDESLMHAVNVDGTSHLLDLASGRVRRWVQLSSVGVYGPCRVGPVREDAVPNPVNRYERTKAEADRLVVEAAARSGFEWTMLRPSNVYGPDMPNASLRQLAAAVRRRRFFFIGPQGATANYVYVDNVVAALMLCGWHPHAANRVFNLSDCCALEAFVGAMAVACGSPAPQCRLPEGLVRLLAMAFRWVPGNPLTSARIDAMTGRATYPTDRIAAELGYVPATSMEEGVALSVLAWESKESTR